jgi:hypothetical protein
MRALGEKFLWNFQYPGADMMLSTWDMRNVMVPPTPPAKICTIRTARTTSSIPAP